MTSTRTATLAASARHPGRFECPAAAQVARGPAGQFRAADLRIVADVDREGGMEGEGVDGRGMHEAFADVAQLVGDPRPLGPGDPGLQLDAEQRLLRAALADADQG